MHDVIVDMNVKLEILHYTLCYARLGRKQQEAMQEPFNLLVRKPPVSHHHLQLSSCWEGQDFISC